MKKPVEFPIHLEYGISIPDFILALSQATEDLFPLIRFPVARTLDFDFAFIDKVSFKTGCLYWARYGQHLITNMGQAESLNNQYQTTDFT